MPKGNISDIEMYDNNTVGPIEQKYEASKIAIMRCEVNEQFCHAAVVIESCRLISSIIRTIKAMVKAIKVSIRNARLILKAQAAAAATVGVGEAVAAPVTAGLFSHILIVIGKCHYRIIKLLKRIYKVWVAISKWSKAVDQTDAARKQGKAIEQQLMEARMQSAGFMRRVAACRKRIQDHKEGVVKFYKALVENNIIPRDIAIQDNCSSHDDDKLKMFNLARQALRMVPKGMEPPDGKYLSMMKAVVEEHVHENKHHPEFWNGATVEESHQDASKMPLMYVGEMCADWAAMSEELGTSLIEWMNKVVDKRWMFTDEQKALIKKCCEFLAPYTKSGARDYGYVYFDPRNNKPEATDVKAESVVTDGAPLTEGPVAKQDVIGAIHVLLNLLDDNGSRMQYAEPIDPPVDVEYVDAEVEPDPLPYNDEGVSRTEETEHDMNLILDQMSVPTSVRDVAPQLLNNIVQQDDGSFTSIDGTVHLDDEEALRQMIGATLCAISKVMSDGAHMNVSIGDDLRSSVTVRDRFGHRNEITIDPVIEV